MKEIIAYLKREWLFLLIFILLISFSQGLILKSHLEFGFSPDDIWFFSDFSRLGSQPFLKFNQVWQDAGPYHAPHIYYNGILFSFFGFNHQAYQIASLIFKILSIISFYILIQVVFRNRLLTFISALIFSLHYSSLGSFEMVSRTQDYLLITGINIFLIFFYLIHKESKNLLWITLASAVLFFSFFINPIRAYPMLPFILFLGALIFFKNKSLSNFYWVAKNLTIIFLPLILFFILMGTGGAFYNNILFILKKVSQGNLQLLLTPITTVGGLFLIGDGLKFLASTSWNFNSFLSYFLGGPLVIFGLLTLFLSTILSKRPIKFFCLVFITNFILELLLFFIVDKVLNLPEATKISYDPFTYAPGAVLGIYIIVLTIFIFKEWLNDQKNIFLSLYLLGMLFAANHIWLTWIFQDFIYIPLGINGYSTLPSMGISAAIASILTLIYTKFKNNKILKNFAPSVFLILIPYFFLSNDQIQIYLTRFLDSGGMKASDQVSMKNKFWQFIQEPTSCNKFFYLYTKGDHQNEYAHSVIMIDRFDKWHNLYGPFKSKVPCPVALLVNDEDKLISSYGLSNNTEGFFYKDFDGVEKFFPLKDFYAFKLQNKNIIDIKSEIMEKIRPQL